MISVLELTLLDLKRSLFILSLDPECLLDLDLPLLESLLPEPDLVWDLEVEEGILGSFLLEIEKKIIIKISQARIWTAPFFLFLFMFLEAEPLMKRPCLSVCL